MHDTTSFCYQERDHETWRRFYCAIEKLWVNHADILHPFYRQNIHVLNPFRDRIPSLVDIAGVLEPVGWTCAWVEGYAPPWDIARMLDKRIMPLSRSIRPPEEVFFAREPDLLHDLFGHLPALMSAEYRDLLSQWARVASKQPVTETDRAHYHLNKLIAQSHDKVPHDALAHLTEASQRLARFVSSSPTRVSILDKLYFWIFEFGLIEQQGQRQILGAGLLSSLSEVERFAAGSPTTGQLNVETIMSPYNISSAQTDYFAASSVQHLRDVIGGVVKALSPLPKPEVSRHVAV